MPRLTWGFFSAIVLFGCSTEEREMPPLHLSSRAIIESLHINVVQREPGRNSGIVPTGSPGQAINAYLYTMTNSGLVNCYSCSGGAALINLGVIAAIVVLGAPVVAVKSAISTEDPEDVKKASNTVLPILQDDAWGTRIGSRFSETVGSDGQVFLSADQHASSWLRLHIDGPVLDIEGTDALPAIVVQGELMNGNTCLADRFWRWNGYAADFLDFAEDDGKMLKKQLGIGAGMLGEAIAQDLFLSDEPRHAVHRKSNHPRQRQPLMALEPHSYENELASWPGPTEDYSPGIPCGAVRKSP
jgi:hypothetical protein